MRGALMRGAPSETRTAPGALPAAVCPARFAARFAFNADSGRPVVLPNRPRVPTVYPVAAALAWSDIAGHASRSTVGRSSGSVALRTIRPMSGAYATTTHALPDGPGQASASIRDVFRAAASGNFGPILPGLLMAET